MAADAINVSDTCYLTAVRYYLANLGTTMESQVRSSVGPPTFCLPCIFCPNLFSCPPSHLLRLAVCRAPPLTSPATPRRSLFDLVAARLSRTRILAVTSDLTSYQIPDDRIRREDSSETRTPTVEDAHYRNQRAK